MSCYMLKYGNSQIRIWETVADKNTIEQMYNDFLPCFTGEKLFNFRFGNGIEQFPLNVLEIEEILSEDDIKQQAEDFMEGERIGWQSLE